MTDAKERSTKTFRLGELFCGPGGIGVAASRASASNSAIDFRISHAWATDYDADACATYRNNLMRSDPGAVLHKDIREKDVLSNLADISDIDALAFGFPCNDFSIVGESKGIDGEFGPLYSYGVKALKLFQPEWFFAENVSGLSSSNEGAAFKIILKELQEAGYKLYPHRYSFDLYGVPQKRVRIVIIGIRDDLPFQFKIPSPEPFSDQDVSASNAILNPPIHPDAYNNELTRQNKTVVERLKYIKPGENAWTADIPSHLQLNVKGARISQIYRRLESDKPSYTVTGSGGGGTHVYHWEEPRALTNRERARLQTFPDEHVFSGKKESVRKQIGMAVPPKGAEVILNAVLASFAGIEYPSIEPNVDAAEAISSLSNMIS